MHASLTHNSSHNSSRFQSFNSITSKNINPKQAELQKLENEMKDSLIDNKKLKAEVKYWNQETDIKIKQLEEKSEILQHKVEALDGIKPKIYDVLAQLSKFQNFNATVCAQGVFGQQTVAITANDGSLGTNYVDINVLKNSPNVQFNLGISALARSDELKSYAAISDSTIPLNLSGSYTFTSSTTGSSAVITVDTTDTLQDICNALNNVTPVTGIAAIVIPGHGGSNLVLAHSQIATPINFVSTLNQAGDTLPNLSTTKAVQPIASNTVALNWSGTITFAATDTTQPVPILNINPTDTLNNIVNNINNLTNANIRASLDSNSNGYILVYRNQNYSDPLTVVNNVAGPLQQLPLSSIRTIDDLSANYSYYGNTNTSPSNLIKVNNFQFNLKKVTPGLLTVQVQINPKAIDNAVNQLIDSHNAFVEEIDKYLIDRQYPGKEQAYFKDDFFLYKAKNFVQQKIISYIPGLSDQLMRSLNLVGFSVKNGYIKLNESKFAKCLENSPSNIQALLGRSYSSDNAQVTLVNFPNQLSSTHTNITINLTVTCDINNNFSATLTNIQTNNQVNLLLTDIISLASAVSIDVKEQCEFYGYSFLIINKMAPNSTVTANFSGLAQGMADAYRGLLENWMKPPSNSNPNVAIKNNKLSIYDTHKQRIEIELTAQQKSNTDDIAKLKFKNDTRKSKGAQDAQKIQDLEIARKNTHKSFKAFMK